MSNILCRSFDKQGLLWRMPLITEVMYKIHKFTCSDVKETYNERD